jgi:hypothetical protein
MIIPEVIFRYSYVYDEIWKECSKIYKRKFKEYPSPRKIINYIEKVKKLWRKDEKKILRELSKITGLKWKSKYIVCYVVGKCIPFSDPLTMSIYEKQLDYFIDTLIHELIHQLFIQERNYEKTKKSWSYIFRKYSKESENTKIHIVLYAIHTHIYLKFFNEKRLKRDIEQISFLPDYKRAWEIVQNDGYKNIIREYTKRIK